MKFYHLWKKGIFFMALGITACQQTTLPAVSTYSPTASPRFTPLPTATFIPTATVKAVSVPSATPTVLIKTTRSSSSTLNQQIYIIKLLGEPAQTQQEQFLQSLEKTLNRKVEVLYQYDVAYNGFAVWLTKAEAKTVATMPDVQRVTLDSERYPHSDQSSNKTR